MARKVNTKFVAVIAIIAMGVGAAGFVAYRKFHKDPKVFIARGDALLKEGKDEEAAKHYALAALRLKDPSLWTKSGDLYLKIAYDDRENLGKAYGFWSQAVAIDGNYAPALTRLLTAAAEELDMTEGGGKGQQFDVTRDFAEKLLRADPENKQAKAIMPTLVIRSWLSGIETEPQKIQDALKELSEQQKADPQNADVSFYIARAQLRQAEAKANTAGAPAGEALYAETLQTIESATKAQDQNGDMHFRAAQIMAELGSKLGKTNPALGKKYQENFKNEINRAVAVGKPQDRFYAESRMRLADILAGEDKLADAEKICREAMDQRLPQDLAIRIRLATLLNAKPDRRDDAIALLTKLPEPTAEQKAGARGARLREQELKAKADLASMRLDKASTTEDPAARAALIAQVNEAVTLLSGKGYGDAPITLRLQGKSALLNKQTAEAIRCLTKAANAFGEDDRSLDKYQSMFLLASAYRQAQQFGEAKRVFQQIVSQYTGATGAKQQLAEMMLFENDIQGAKPYIEQLLKEAPDMPAVKRMSIALMVDQKAPKEEIQKQYNQFPEKTRGERMYKAMVARVIQDIEDSKRLLELILKDDPADAEAAVSLARLMENLKNDKPAAVAVIEAALKAKPNDANLLLEQQRLGGATPEQMLNATEKIVSNMDNPVDRKLAEMEVARQKKDIPGMVRALDEAEKLSPNDVRVLDLRFNYALMKSDWDTASKYAARLGAPEVNADKVSGQLYAWRLAMAQNDLAKATEVAETLTRDFGAFAQSWVSKGQTQQALGNLEAAMTSFTQARDKQPQNVEAYRGLIECSYRRSRPQEAKKYIDNARQVLRGNQEFNNLADDWDLRYGNPDKALATREAALAKDPESAQAYMSLGMGYIDAAKLKQSEKNEQAEKELLTKAQATFQKALEKFPDNVAFTSNFATAALMLKDFAAAQKAWLAFAGREAFKDKLETAQMLADFYCNAEKYDLAEKAMSEYIAKHPDDMNGRYSLSAVFARQKKYEQAVDALGPSDDPRVMARKTELLIAGGKFDQAEKMLAPVAASDRASIDVLNALGYIYQKSKRPREAVDTLNKVLAQDPKNTTALLYRSGALLDLPQPNLDELIRDLTTVRQASASDTRTSGNLESRRLLAECYRRKNDFEAEFRELEDLIRVAPTDKNARVLLLDAYASTNPPRWGDAERIASEVKDIPDLDKDVDIKLATARMWSRKGKAQNNHQAFQSALMDIQSALQQQPKNLYIVQVFYSVMLQGQAYRQLLDHTNQMPQEIRDLWWVKHDRAIAKAKLKDPSAIQDFTEALNQCLAAKDDASAQLIVNSMATELTVGEAKKAVEKQVQTGQPQWLMIGATLEQKGGNIPAARKLVDQVLAQMDKLSDPQQANILGYAGVLYMIEPDPDLAKAKEIYQRLTKLRPDDFTVWNNLACLKDISPEQSLEYSQKAVELMRRTGRQEPYVLDTHGWNLVQANRIDEGIANLNDAWSIEQFPDLAYHLGVANMRKSNLDQADKYLQQAMQLFQTRLEAKAITSMKLQDDIVAAQKELRELRTRAAAQNN